jgi:EmrB/QacA subfamily drug resistance transporter
MSRSNPLEIPSRGSLASEQKTTAAGSERPHRLALVVIAAAQLMVMLDLTIVNVALPAMQRALHFSSTDLTWVINAYVLVFGGLLLLGGRTGDLFGRRRMFVVGVAAFATASLVGGLATDQAWLISARAVQGIGAAIASPTALALVASTFEEGHERNRAMAVYAAMSAAGGALGLLLGGLLVELASWRWVLFVNVPIAALVLALTPRAIPRSLRPAAGARRLDLPGALTISGGMALLVYGLVRAPSAGWGSSETIGAFVGAAVVLTAFVLIEQATSEPLIPLRFLRHRRRAAGYGVMLLLGASMLSLIYFLTQFLQDVLHYSPVLAGVAYLPIPVSVALTSAVVSRLVRRHGVRPFVIVGPLLVGGGLLWLSQINATATYLDVFGPLVSVGVGMGLAFVPLTLNAVSSVQHHQQGLASALLNTSQQVGGSLGLAALVTVAASATRSRLLRGPGSFKGASQAAPGALSVAGSHLHTLLLSATVQGYDTAFRTGALGGALAFLLAVTLLRGGRKPAPGGQPATLVAEGASAAHHPGGRSG